MPPKPAGKSKGPVASLLPENAGGGFDVPEGDYLWKDVYADLHDYNGTVVPGEPAIFLVLQNLKSNEEFTVTYLAGKGDFITPADDKTHFVHPDGESTPQFYKQGDAVRLMRSLLDANYPREKMEESGLVTQFIGLKAHMVPGAKNVGKEKSKEKEGKTIPLVGKIIAMPEAKATAPTRTGAAAKPAVGTGTASRAAQTATPANGLDETAIDYIKNELAKAGDAGLTLKKLGANVYMAAVKAKDQKNALEYKKLALDGEWLEANSEAGEWVVSDDAIMAVPQY